MSIQMELDVTENNENVEHAYRPLSVKNMILRDKIKIPIMKRLEEGVFGNMMFFGNIAGTGKTTIARAICNDLGMVEGKDFIFHNGSQANTKFINEDIPDFLNKASGRKKFVILDEFDNKALHIAQNSFRQIIDKYSGVASFIFTGNDISAVSDAIKSRCRGGFYDFDEKGTFEEQKKITAQMTIRLQMICEHQGIDFPDRYRKDVAKFVYSFLPSLRDVLHTFNLVLYENNKIIDDRFIEILKSYSVSSDEIVGILRSKNLSAIRRYSYENSSKFSRVIDVINDFVYDNFQPEDVVAVGMVMGECGWQYGLAPNKENHLKYMLEQLIGATDAWGRVDFKDIENLGA